MGRGDWVVIGIVIVLCAIVWRFWPEKQAKPKAPAQPSAPAGGSGSAPSAGGKPQGPSQAQ